MDKDVVYITVYTLYMYVYVHNTYMCHKSYNNMDGLKDIILSEIIQRKILMSSPIYAIKKRNQKG